MKKILILCMSMLIGSVYAENLDSFSDVQDALTSGKDLLEVWGSILSADQTKVLSKVNKAIVCKLGKAANIYD